MDRPHTLKKALSGRPGNKQQAHQDLASISPRVIWPTALSRQQEPPFNGDEPGCGLDQARRCELPRAINFDLYAMGVPESFDDKVEITIAGCQHGDITFFGQLDHVESDADVPVTLRGPIASLNEWFEFHFEADGLQDLLKLNLLRVTTIDGIREGMDDFSSRGHRFPERRVVEVTSVALLYRVEDILDVYKDSDALH